MVTKIIGVVSDVFKNVSDGESIFTYNRIIEMLEKGELRSGVLSLEQGIPEEKVIFLKNTVENYGLLHDLAVHSYFDKFQRCPNELTHKEKTFNTLISEPIKQIDHTYHSVLMIDDRCSELSDHVTGQHIQGMMLMEAARQMTIATLEKYFVQGHQNKRVSYVMNEFQSHFYSYAFPVSTMLYLKIIHTKGNAHNRIFNLSISIEQNSKKVAEVFRTVSTYDARFIKHREKVALKNYIEAHFKPEKDSKALEKAYEKVA